MALKVAINGTGRIGMIVAKIVTSRDDIELVAINTTATPQMLEYLFKYDSVHKGVDAKVIELCLVDDSFDVITAVFDMLNYLNRDGLKSFLLCISNHLNSGGHFLCDINTLYGFEEVAVGAFIVDDDSRFLTIESDFEDNIYSSEFTLFEKRENGIYHKSQETIKQYYYTPEEIEEILSDVGLELIENSGVLYISKRKIRDFYFLKREIDSC
jgi:predicted TPR repeat methyltransferase